MFFNKIAKFLGTKNLLTASLLLSSVSIAQSAPDNLIQRIFSELVEKTRFEFKAKKQSLIKKAGLSLLTIATSAIIAYIILRCYKANNRAEKQNDIIAEFIKDKNFKKFEKNSRDEYFAKTFFASSSSLEHDWAAQWLEKDATQNKKYIKFMGWFSNKFNRLGKEMTKNLNDLRHEDDFIDDRKKLNPEIRKNLPNPTLKKISDAVPMVKNISDGINYISDNIINQI